MPKAFLIKKSYWIIRRAAEKAKSQQNLAVLSTGEKSTDGPAASLPSLFNQHQSSAFELFVNPAKSSSFYNSSRSSAGALKSCLGDSEKRALIHDNKCLRIDATNPRSVINFATGTVQITMSIEAISTALMANVKPKWHTEVGLWHVVVVSGRPIFSSFTHRSEIARLLLRKFRQFLPSRKLYVNVFLRTKTSFSDTILRY